MADELVARTAKAIHTLFYATERAADRYRQLEASLEGDEELAAFQALNIGLINFDSLPPEIVAGLRVKAAELAERADEPPPTPSERISLEAIGGEDGEYARRLLEYMYAHWDGTLEYEAGRHRLVLFSPFDEQMRRHSVFVNVSVDGYCPDLLVRSYILGPYLLVEDKRTKLKSDDPWRVLHGDLTPILPEGPDAA